MSTTVICVTYQTGGQTESRRPTIAGMEQAARRILLHRGVDPDGIADQGDIAEDLGVARRTISVYRQMYRGAHGVRGVGRAGPYQSSGEDAIEAFPAPTKTVGGGGGNPVWLPRWQGLAWALTRERGAAALPAEERALIADLL